MRAMKSSKREYARVFFFPFLPFEPPSEGKTRPQPTNNKLILNANPLSQKNGKPFQRVPVPALAAPLLVEAKQGGGKLKTKKAASKRIKVTATGKVLVRKAGKQHINEKMSSAKLNEKSKMARVPDRELPNVIKCLPYAGISK